MKKYNIGLFGFGCVGQGFSELLATNPDINAKIVKVSVKQVEKPRPNLPGSLVHHPDEILEDDTIDVVVELIDDAKAAFKIVSKALALGKKVITANKKMVAEHLSELLSLESKCNGTLLYEGAVGGSIPILSTIRNYYSQDKITAIGGILNGSTNYILTKVIEQNLSYEEALHEAKVNGFAESDPSLDVLGYDPSYKLSILIHKAFGSIVSPNKIFKKGITDLSQRDIDFARQHGLKVKLIAEARQVNNQIHAWICPKFIDDKDPFYLVNDEFNVVKIESEGAGTQFLTGKGAGKLPTGLAVLADLATVLDGQVPAVISRAIPLGHDKLVEVYIGHKSEQVIDWSHFETISEKSHGKTYSYAIGKISLKGLNTFQNEHNDVSIIFTSDNKRELNINRLTYQSKAIAVDTV